MHQHRDRRIVLAFAVASALLIPVVPAGAQTPADNTKVNTRDRAKGAATADQQKENTTDREITQTMAGQIGLPAVGALLSKSSAEEEIADNLLTQVARELMSESRTGSTKEPKHAIATEATDD